VFHNLLIAPEWKCRPSSWHIGDKITETQEDTHKKSHPVGEKIKRVIRLKKVAEKITEGKKNWQIAEELGVTERTIQRDCHILFKNLSREEEINKLQYQVDFAIGEAKKNYREAKTKKEKAMFLHLYNQIARTKAVYLPKQEITFIGQQNNTKVDIRAFIAGLKEEKKEKKEVIA